MDIRSDILKNAGLLNEENIEYLGEGLIFFKNSTRLLKLTEKLEKAYGKAEPNIKNQLRPVIVRIKKLAKSFKELEQRYKGAQGKDAQKGLRAKYEALVEEDKELIKLLNRQSVLTALKGIGGIALVAVIITTFAIALEKTDEAADFMAKRAGDLDSQSKVLDTAKDASSAKEQAVEKAKSARDRFLELRGASDNKAENLDKLKGLSKDLKKEYNPLAPMRSAEGWRKKWLRDHVLQRIEVLQKEAVDINLDAIVAADAMDDNLAKARRAGNAAANAKERAEKLGVGAMNSRLSAGAAGKAAQRAAGGAAAAILTGVAFVLSKGQRESVLVKRTLKAVNKMKEVNKK